ncbi:unnamed protein product [Rotaria sordida]|uniref:Uncharacterized protein n=1 Tax=Rotaria sordida TaxID=392033 RepID=A0A814IH01_9BILA|nr:unnamed protein product [Rotaria sordida]CAF1497187.1 unnamed protein product [Rotaria sordida]
MSKASILRVQSSDGTKRVDINSQDTYKTIYQKVAQAFSLASIEDFTLYKEKNKQSSLGRTQNRTNFKHGDMIYLIAERENLFPTDTTASSSSSYGTLDFKSDTPTNGNSYASPKIGSFQTNNMGKLNTINNTDIKEDDVDIQLDKMDGRIPRKRNPQLCHHNVHGKCLHCIPIEPYDEEFLKNRNPPIKHMSFRAYIRKLQSSAASDRTTFASLENISCSIKEKCATGHAPWPKGVCTKCQPNPVTLMRQPYRHVDNIMFENGNMVNRFLNYWRSSGHQRIGFLYGRYEVYDGVPLGVRAVVAAIYEPPQETSRDSVKLNLPDPHEALIDDLARRLNIRRIGWIFTDLVPDESKSGSGPVLHHRGNVNSYFLSAQECIMAGWLQNNHPNVCKYSPDGYFGSKFVTVVVTGDVSGQIHFEGYQVSNQCMALVKSKILLPTYDAPELGYVRETSSEQYVPDVYYKEKDSYNNEIMKIARPLPLEYLIIDVPTGFPSSDAQIQSTFNDDCKTIKTPFCVENRMQIGELQDMNALASYLQQFSKTTNAGITTAGTSQYKATDILADIHLLRYLAVNDIISFSMDQLDPLLDSIRTNDLNGVETWMEGSDWQTIVQVLQTHSPSPTVTGNRPSYMDFEDQRDLTSSLSQWNCPRCTFINDGSSRICEICSCEKESDKKIMSTLVNRPSGGASSGITGASNDGSTDNDVLSQYKVLTLTFNQDCTSLAMGTRKTYALFTISPDNKIDEIYDCAYDDVCIIERLFSSSLTALVSNQAPRKLKVCHFKKGTEICSYSFANTILAVKLNRLRLIVCLEESIYIHNMRDMKVLHTIRDVPSNREGLCALSSNSENSYLAYPGSSLTGEVQVFDTLNLKSGVMISAHESPLAAIAFDMTGTKLATASNKGTVIRVHSAVDGTRLFEFRRGVRRAATIYSLAFSPDSMFLAASSNTETIHIFRLANPKEKAPEEATWMGYLGRKLSDVAHYLPKQTSEVLTQDRSFAFVHLQSPGMKTAIAMNVLNKTLKLFVAGYDGVVCVYEVNTNDGGECKQISQHLLFSMSSNSNNQQIVTTNETRNSIDGSGRTYSTNIITNDNATVPLSSTSPVTTPTTGKNFIHQSSNIPNDEQNFPRLPSSPPGLYD